MRRKKADLRTRVNHNLAVEFTAEGLTSYAGLELLIRYLRGIGWNRQLRRHLSAVVPGSDFGMVGLCRVLLGLLLVGGRRLRHLGFLQGDPLLQRFCGLKDLPTDGSVSRWLKRFTVGAEEALKTLNAACSSTGSVRHRFLRRAAQARDSRRWGCRPPSSSASPTRVDYRR